MGNSQIVHTKYMIHFKNVHNGVKTVKNHTLGGRKAPRMIAAQCTGTQGGKQRINSGYLDVVKTCEYTGLLVQRGQKILSNQKK